MTELPSYETSKVWQQPQLSFFKEGTRTIKSTSSGVGEVSGVTGSVDLWEIAKNQVRAIGVVIPF